MAHTDRLVEWVKSQLHHAKLVWFSFMVMVAAFSTDFFGVNVEVEEVPAPVPVVEPAE